MNNNDFTRLKKAAEKATPGNWVWIRGYKGWDDDLQEELDFNSSLHAGGERVLKLDIEGFHPQISDANAEYIALASPANVSFLLELLEQVANKSSTYSVIDEDASDDSRYSSNCIFNCGLDQNTMKHSSDCLFLQITELVKGKE